MNINPDTLAALGYGDAWERLAICWPLYVVTRQPTRRDWRKGRATTQRPVASALTTHQRREAARLAGIGRGATEIARRLGVTRDTVRHYLASRRAA